jgi:preprotein translocase subunit YajC
VSQLWPFAVMLLIFYFIVLMPMRKRQKKVQEFQASLKAGDRVITTGGIHGEVTKVTNDIVQLQIADKVRINVARASIGGYQGQEPVVQQDRAGI